MASLSSLVHVGKSASKAPIADYNSEIAHIWAAMAKKCEKVYLPSSPKIKQPGYLF